MYARRRSTMLSARCSSRPSLTSLPARAGLHHLVHPVGSAFAPSAVLRQASTPSTPSPGTASDGLGSIWVSDNDGNRGSAPDPPRRSDGAGAAQHQQPSSSSSHRANPEVCFYKTFLFSSVDLHLILLEEAHRKHEVWLNVPPQLAPSIPNVGPPAVPEPIYPAAQQARLAAMSAATPASEGRRTRLQDISSGSATDATELIRDPSSLAYRPTHGPPPFATTGTRSLWIPAQRRAEAAAAAAAASSADVPVSSAPTFDLPGETASCDEVGLAEGSATARVTQAEAQTVAIRNPVDASMLYHCSACGRAFRRLNAAELHVQQRHEQQGNGGCSNSAVVMEGPGPGEIIRYEERAAPLSAAVTTEPLSVACTTGPSPRKAAVGGKRGGASDAVATAKDTANASSDAKPPTFDRAAAYRSTPRVDLPEDALINHLLEEVWDKVALARDDIEKLSAPPATLANLRQHPKQGYDSLDGRVFMPSVLFVEGTADNRTDLEKSGERAAVRATPEGAAPGIKRRHSSVPPVLSFSAVTARLLPTQRRNADGTLGAGSAVGAAGGGIGGAALGAAPTAQELSIAELSRHYPNPFGDSPNAALVESEKEPINPFVDVEGKAAAVAAARKAAASPAAQSGTAAGSAADEAVSALATEEMEWLSRWAARPYACPLCQRRTLPDLMKIMAPLLPSSLRAEGEATAFEAPAAVAGGEDGGATRHQEGDWKGAAAAAVPLMSPAGVVEPSPRATHSAPTPGSLEDRPLTVDVEAWSWYANRVPRFRLLDSLEDHLQSEHAGCRYEGGEAVAARDGEDGDTGGDEGDSLSDADWRRLYQVPRHQQVLARAELLAVQEAYRTLFPRQQSTSAEALSASKRAGMGSASDVGSDAEGAAIRVSVRGSEGPLTGASPSPLSAEAATTADSTEAPQLHVRSAVNTVLIGTVRDVQEGFLGAARVLQYVLAVRHSSAESSGAVSADATGSNAAADDDADADEDEDEDLIVVRCVGDLVPSTLLKQQVRLGTTMFVAGSLRMNRNVDTVSRRSHAYPFVQVVPPLGCVRVLGG
ncbi:hypothetical protein LSCM1_08258 [Leishmania martiniquensis]|uniref:C2H2-type domain-containing protein n=1 Tax=Leishmania martiniquensis TaxID=1580590 RepID=A0A836L471_9TRYP|nr:hypothetical protein LSCM1_08258 [Leishmania martiniquensis]